VGGTRELAAVIEKALGRRGPHHPATQTFQALRIAVNGELEAVEKVLPMAVQALGVGGRLAVISFHSLEDRLVKEYFRREGKDCLCPPRQPLCTCGHKASIKEIARRPITPTEQETSQNPRARSAKLRVAEKL
jgi:16S rRNA (cytosine1402-N4)-methyltransferase